MPTFCPDEKLLGWLSVQITYRTLDPNGQKDSFLRFGSQPMS